MDEGRDVYNFLKKSGCCDRCSIRFLGDQEPSSFRNCETTLYKKGYLDLDENKSKMVKMNPCTACLGLLHAPYSDHIFNQVIEEAKKIKYDSDTFNLTLTTPVAYYLRAQSIWTHLKTQFPNFISKNFPLDLVTIGVKDAWKYLYIERLEKALNKRNTSQSDLKINLNVSYEDEAKECECLFQIFPNTFSKSRNKKYHGSVDIFSRKSAENVLRDADDKIINKYFNSLPTIPNTNVEFKELTGLHNSIFIAGRYNKWSRVLSQTPWILDGQRKMETSVQELICEPILYHFKGLEYKFSSSGREDVDVRNIGRGRPFYVEIVDPKKTRFTFNDMRLIENEINEKSHEKIFLRDLQTINKEELSSVKLGEEVKTKDYCALIIRPDGQSLPDISILNQIKDIQINQATPLRVLHRRPVAVRPRTIHWMEATLIPNEKYKFKLRLNTQAGTYIKEFIHGDFGRTKPSLGDLVGGVEFDILALDVEEISLNWPPEIDYSVL